MSIVDFLQPSLEQRPAVEARGRDLVVTAGAGAGKTRTLVARYLSLLDEGVPVRAVVAITFTRRAALEMRNRIRDRVAAYLRQAGLPAAEALRWQLVFEQLDGARIGTIHSLCAEIIRAHPAEAGVDPRFDLLDETTAALMRIEAVSAALDETAPDAGVIAVVDALGREELGTLLDDLLTRRGDAAPALDQPTNVIEAAWRAAARAALGAFLDDADAIEAMDALADLRRGTAWREAMDRSDPLAPALAEAETIWAALRAEWARGEAARMGALVDGLRRLMAALPLNKGRKDNWKSADPKPLIAAARAVLDTRIAPLLGKPKAPADWAQDERALTLMPSLRTLFLDAVRRYESAKRKRFSLDFEDLEAVALDLLRRHPAARETWRAEVAAVLVDEYQDTNARQAELARLLAGAPGRHFVVGDGKQSIYRFRGGDVTVLRAEAERVTREGGPQARLNIVRSYRAHKHLLDGLEALLRPVLGLPSPNDPPWKQAFEPLEAGRLEPRPGFASPHITLSAAIRGEGDRAGDAAARAADALAADIADWVRGGAMRVRDEDGDRPLRYDDIAILCRAASSFKTYEDALERASIPYLTVGGTGFFERPEVRDVINLLRAIENPHDDAALAGALRSPVFGVSDYGLAQLFDGRDATRPVWAQLDERLACANPADVARAARARDVLRSAMATRGRVTVADLLKRVLDETSYPAALLAAGQARGGRNLNKLLATARDSGTASLRTFLEYVGAMRDTGAREGEARAVAEGATQIMTAHAAKGLEFPIVVLGDANRGAGGRGRFLLDPALGLALRLSGEDDGAQPLTYLLAARDEDAREVAEAGRLLYVAATRAQEKLVISADFGLTRHGAPANLGGWLKMLVGEGGALDLRIGAMDTGAAVHAFDLHAGSVTVRARLHFPGAPKPQPAPATEADEIPWVASPLAAPLGPRPPAPPSRFQTRVTARVRGSGAPAWIVGQLAHRAAQLWRIADPSDDWLRVEARNQGLVEEQQIADAVRRARRVLSRLAAHGLYGQLNGAERRLHEVPFETLRAGASVSGIIDCLARIDGKWWVIDFKTDQVRDRAALMAKIHEGGYRVQVQQYADAVEAVLGERPTTKLCFLDVGGEVVVTDG